MSNDNDHFLEKQKNIAPAKRLENSSNNASTLKEALEELIIGYFINLPIVDEKINTIDPILFSGNSYKSGSELRSLNQDIIRAIAECRAENIASSPENIAIKCTQGNRVYIFIKEIEKKLIDPVNIDEYIKRIKNEYALNAIKNEVMVAEKEGASSAELAEKLRKALDTVQSSTSIIHSQDYYLEKDLQEMKSDKSLVIATGIPSLDFLFNGGFRKAELTSLTGGAGSGKTAFALQIADSIASQSKYVLYFSMEIKRSKLTERSLKRIYYQEYERKKLELAIDERLPKSADKYREFYQYIKVVEGYEGMSIAELRSSILRVLDDIGQELLVIIDPFQRLSSGNHELDSMNETLKVNKLCSGIKRIANESNIPILMLSDTTKAHKSNQTGEGSARGSYMTDHTVDSNLMIRTDRNEPLKALIGDLWNKEEEARNEFAYFSELKSATDILKKNITCNQWDKWAAIVTSKQRNNATFNPLFIYRPAYHYFEDMRINEKFIKPEKIFF